MLATLALGFASACADEPVCTEEREVRYTCEPVAAPSPDTCTGGPTYQGTRFDPELSFPAGCEARIVRCSSFYQTCYCQTSVMTGEVIWLCPL